MKKRIIALLMVIMAMTLLTGCDVHVYELPEMLQRPAERMYIPDDSYIHKYQVIYLDEDQSELAEKCFDSIKLQGVTLALPMNVSDLPDGYTVEKSDDVFELNWDVYNGYVLEQANICRGDYAFITVEVLYKKGGDINDGQIVAMYFSSLGGVPELGEGVITRYTTTAQIWESFGTPENHGEADDECMCCCYILKDGRILYVQLFTSEEFVPSDIYLIMDSGSAW